MYEIHAGLLWLGHALDIREPGPLMETGITAVIDVAYEELPAQLPRQLIYCRFPLNDGGGNDATVLLQAVQTLVDLLANGTRTIIACSAGMSRSPTVAAHSLAFHLSKQPEDVISRIAEMKSLELKPELWNDVGSVFPKIRRAAGSD